MSRFSEIFQMRTSEDSEMLATGEVLPLNQTYSSNRNLLICLSFNCLRCMELIEELKSCGPISGIEIVLLTDGSFVENQQLSEYLMNRYPVKGLESQEFELLKVYSKPYYYVVDQNKIIIGSGKWMNLSNIQEMLRFEFINEVKP